MDNTLIDKNLIASGKPMPHFNVQLERKKVETAK